MTKKQKLIDLILAGTSDHNIEFSQLLFLLEGFGFELRIKGSHHILYHSKIDEIINLQPTKNNKAKAYQVKQVRTIIINYSLNK
jgi:predicted RNA binding protein YcfA (HicA-like mRNA interferase family)